MNTHDFVFGDSDFVPIMSSSRLDKKARLSVGTEPHLPANAIRDVSRHEGRLLTTTDHSQWLIPDLEAVTKGTMKQGFALSRVDIGDRWELIDHSHSQN